jgi:hypothetical protein
MPLRVEVSGEGRGGRVMLPARRLAASGLDAWAQILGSGQDRFASTCRERLEAWLARSTFGSRNRSTPWFSVAGICSWSIASESVKLRSRDAAYPLPPRTPSPELRMLDLGLT